MDLLARKKLLLVDDDPFVRRVVEMTFGDTYQVLHANDGPMALEVIWASDPDLVLMDVNMPGLNGIDTCAAVKADPASRSVPIIMLTGQADAELRRGAERAGAVGLFTKPFSPLDLLEMVRRYLG